MLKVLRYVKYQPFFTAARCACLNDVPGSTYN